MLIGFVALYILCLTRYAPEGASSRVRVFQYLDFLRGQGVHVDAHPLLDAEYIAALYQGRRYSLYRMLRAYFLRVRLMLSAGQYDVVWYEKELLPWLPAWFERFFLTKNVCRVVDYDDAIHERYLTNNHGFVRWFFGGKIARVMGSATAVVVGSHALAAYAQQADAPQVYFLPSVVDLVHYPVRTVSAEQPFTVGWIGTPVTAQKYLPVVIPALRLLAEYLDFRLVLIGAGDVSIDGFEVERRDWRLNEEGTLLADVDVGIMPLTDGRWEAGKCGYKLIQYMACGIPVVASAVGENNYIVSEGENGFLVRSVEEWVAALRVLADDPERARAMGLAGRRRVEETYSLAVTGPRLLEILTDAGRG